MKKIRILIADDHSVVREGLRALLSRVADFAVVGEASDGEEVVRLVGERQPNVVIIDISMPKLNGVEATRRIKAIAPETGVLVLTIHENEEYVSQIVAAGANGYVLKDAGRKELIAAVRAVVGGDRFFSPGVSRMIIEDFLTRSQQHPGKPAESSSMLTGRETEVLQHIARGMTNAQIADKLFLSVRTINTHRTNLMQKLDIHNTAGLVRYAVDHGLVTSE